MRKHKIHHKLEPKKDQKRVIYLILGIILALYVLGIVVRDLKNSLFFKQMDRVNIVMYGPKPQYFSLSNQNDIDYMISFYPDMKVTLPGGYGDYRIGALGKLTTLEGKPELMQHAFASITSSMVHFAFYSASNDVYYGTDESTHILIPPIATVMFSRGNAGFFDRVYIAYMLSQKKPQNFKYISAANMAKDSIFDEQGFLQKYEGYLYSTMYRNDRKNIQLLYMDSYRAGKKIANVLDGSGIRVSDISQTQHVINKCIITEPAGEKSITAKALIDYFHCDYKTGSTDLYDILFELGDLEKVWN